MKILKSIISLCLAAMLSYNIQNAPSVYAAQNELSSETVGYYDHWKEKYLVQNPYSDDTQYYVFYGDETYDEAGYTVPVTVSEAHGYGMLITASMAPYDSNAQEIFDGMFRYYKSFPSSIGSHLMAWQQSDTGSALINADGADSATDGDMDIAYSLLMADTLWGSDGEINYKDEAIAVINDIMTYEVNQKDWVLRLGDWAYDTDENDVYYSATRASDFIMQYMPVFADATGDERWIKLYDSTYSIINKMMKEYGTGLLPDFIVKDSQSGEFIPAPANMLESENDGCYYYNSCRTPWRIGMDYLINKNPDALAFANTITSFMKTETNNDVWNIMAGYTPDGTAVSDWNDLCFNAPLMIAAACGEDTEWHDQIRDMCINYGDDAYFGETISMLCLIVDDGGWIVPESGEPISVIGDVNADGSLTVADAILLQKWLVAVPETRLDDWKAADLYKDDKLDVFDFCLIKKLLIEIKQNKLNIF